jgi:hypothetical protein
VGGPGFAEDALRFPGVQIFKRHANALHGALVTPFFESGRLPARPNPASPQLYPANPLKQAFGSVELPGFFYLNFNRLRPGCLSPEIKRSEASLFPQVELNLEPEATAEKRPPQLS